MSRTPSAAPEAASRAFRAKEDQKSVDITKRVHPRFNLWEKHWRFMLESYQGGPEYLFKGIHVSRSAGDQRSITALNERNLFKYYKEGDSEYQERLQRAHRNNYCKKVVDQIRAFVARKPPVRDEQAAGGAVREFWQNSDGRGRDIDRLMMNELQWAMVFGQVWLLVDKPSVHVESMDEELEAGLPFRLLPVFIAAHGINEIDATGEDMLGRLTHRLREAGYEVCFSGFKDEVLDVLKRTRLYDTIGEEHIWPTQAVAVQRIHARAHTGSSERECPLLKPIPVGAAPEPVDELPAPTPPPSTVPG